MNLESKANPNELTSVEVNPSLGAQIYQELKKLGVLDRKTTNLFVNNIHIHKYTFDGETIKCLDDETFFDGVRLVTELKIDSNSQNITEFKINYDNPPDEDDLEDFKSFFDQFDTKDFSQFNFLNSLKIDTSRISEGKSFVNPSQTEILAIKYKDSIFKMKEIRQSIKMYDILIEETANITEKKKYKKLQNRDGLEYNATKQKALRQKAALDNKNTPIV